MSKSIDILKFDDYLLATIAGTVIIVKRAQEILARISVECSSLNCKIVLLDERTVETREVPSHEIMKLSHEMEKLGLDKIYMAFWCQPHLINKDSELLSLFTFKNEYVVQHFSEKEEATTWLKNQRNS
jgi:hypothetical protein